MGNWSGADMRCPKCNKYLPDRCTCNGPSIEEKRMAEQNNQAERAAPELLPCPFCGGTNIDPAEWSGNDGKSGPGCGDCGALGESAEAWNRRAALPAVVDAEGLPAPTMYVSARLIRSVQELVDDGPGCVTFLGRNKPKGVNVVPLYTGDQVAAAIAADRQARASVPAQAGTVQQPAETPSLGDLQKHSSPHGTLIRLADAQCVLAANRRALSNSCTSMIAMANRLRTKRDAEIANLRAELARQSESRLADVLAQVVQALTDGIPLQEPVYIGKALRAHRVARVVLAGGTGPVAAVHLVNIGLTGWVYTKETAEAYAKGFNDALKYYRGALLELTSPALRREQGKSA